MCSKGSPPSPSAASTAQSGTTAQTGVTSTAADPFAAALYRNYLGSDAQRLRNQPMTPEQLSAASNLYSLGMQAGTFDPAQIRNIESPYVADVVGKTQEAFRNMNRQQANDLLSGAIRSGNAFGGDRAGVAEAALAGQQATAQGPIIAGLYQQGYGQALDEYNRLKAMGLTGAGQAVSGANIVGNRPFELANWYASQIGGLGPLLGQTGTQQQTGSYTGYYTPPQPNPWIQGTGLALAGLGALPSFGIGSPTIGGPGVTAPSFFGPSGSFYRRGGLTPRRFQAGGMSIPSDIEVSPMHDIMPLHLATHGLSATPGMAPMQVPGMNRQGATGSGTGTSSTSSDSSSWMSLIPKAISTAATFLPFLLARGGEVDDVSDRGLSIGPPRGFYGPDPRHEQLPSTPDEFREKYGRDPATDYELEHYFGPASSPIHYLRPKHFQFGGSDSGEYAPAFPGITGGLFTPVSMRGDEPVQSLEGSDATVQPVSLGLRGAGVKVPVFPRTTPERATAEKPAPAAAYAPGTESDIPGLGIREPSAMQRWASSPLTQAGLAMMSTRSPNLLTGIGEGVRGAQTALQQQRAAEVALDTPAKLLEDGPTLRYQMNDGRIVDTKIPNPGFESEEIKAKKEIAAQDKAALAKGYRIVRDPKGAVLSFEPVKGGPADPDVIAGKEGAKAAAKYGTPDTPAPAVVPTPKGPVAREDAGRIHVWNAQYIDDPDNPYDPETGVGGKLFDYRTGGPKDVRKGDLLPNPAEIPGHSTDSMLRDVESWLLEGEKGLPKRTPGMGPLAAKRYDEYVNAVRNYANALAKSRGMTQEELARLQYAGARGAPLRWALGLDGRQTVSLGTAIRHLDTLQELYKAWDPESGSFRLSADIRAKIAKDFGNAAITNIETAASIVGPELVKAIGVAGAGTSEDRETMTNHFLRGTPEQRAGAIVTAQKLLRGQLIGKEQQADAAGVRKDDFVKLVGKGEYEKIRASEEGKPGKTEKPVVPTGVPPGKKIGERRQFDLPGGGGKVWGVWDGKDWKPAGDAI